MSGSSREIRTITASVVMPCLMGCVLGGIYGGDERDVPVVEQATRMHEAYRRAVGAEESLDVQGHQAIPHVLAGKVPYAL